MKYGHTSWGVSGALYPQSATVGVTPLSRALLVSLRRKKLVERRVLAQFVPVNHVRWGTKQH